MNCLLEYEEELYNEIFQNDALLIMAEGLGIERIFLNFLKLYSDSSNLVIILNTHESEEEYFIQKLKENTSLSIYGKEISNNSSADKEQENDKITVQLPTKITTETHTVNERVETYLKGGCFFVTSRILVVDSTYLFIYFSIYYSIYITLNIYCSIYLI